MARPKPHVRVTIEYIDSSKPDVGLSLFLIGRQIAWRFNDKQQKGFLTPTDLGRRLGVWIGDHDPLCGK
jgi:hypothetical protein